MALNPQDSRWNLAAVHPINHYLWSKLKATFGMNESKYGGLTPILPSQQQPQLLQYNEPFLVYNWITESQGSDWYFETDQIMYLIYSQDEADLRRLVNYMRWLFESMDESAQPINDYVRLSGINDYQRFHYKYTQVLAGTGGVLPSETEEGRLSTTVAIRAMYTVQR